MFQFPRFASDPYVFRIRYLLTKVGFPIRKSAGQRLFAPHHSLSQRTTSFIASYCQGIHQMPLGHLIALISNAHSSTFQPEGHHVGGKVALPEKTRSHRDKPKYVSRIDATDKPCHEPASLLRGSQVRNRPCRITNGVGCVPGISPLYDVNCVIAHADEASTAKLVFSFRRSLRPTSCRVMVEPDGIEPTTSSLQS
jgi:hypothetical protein